MAAGIGSVAIPSGSTATTFVAQYQTSGPTYTGNDSHFAQDASIAISRNFNRGAFTKQTEAQATQQQKALAEIAGQIQNRSKELKSNQWVLPVTGYRLTGRFGQRSSLWSTTHTGLDFAGPSGTKIVAIAAGVVKSTGFSGAYGNRTIIALDDGTDIWYAHQSRIVVKPGDKVDPGQVTGYTGATGNVTGPHLHLEVHPGGQGPVNPEVALPKHGVIP